MIDDPYKVLGIPKTATQAEVKKAYRKRAKDVHPDLHPGDPDKLAQFQAVSAANDIIGDADKRKRFDAGEIDATGQEQRPERAFYHQYAGRNGGRRYDPGAGDLGGGGGGGPFDDPSDIFSDLFGRRQGGGQSRSGFQARGADMRYQLEVAFLDAAKGAKRSITLPDGKAIELTIPSGLKDGQTLRLRGKGGAGLGQGPAGDALITFTVLTHPLFSREGDTIVLDLPISIDEAILGAKVEVPTLSGAVSMKIPKGASTGHRMRLKNKGIAPSKGPAGDMIVRLKLVLPETIDPIMEELATKWRDHSTFDPRKDLRRML